MLRKSLIIITLLATCLLSWQSASARVVKVKANWDVGTFKMGGATYLLNYEDAHLKVATKGYIEDGSDPDWSKPTIQNGGFGSSTTNITHAPIGEDDTMTVDWQATPGHAVAGRTHIGAELYLDTSTTASGKDAELRVLSATLTNVSCPTLGGTESAEMPVAHPTFKYKPANSVDWEFSLDDPWVNTPIVLSNIDFWKTTVEPPMSSLMAGTFPALPKTHLLTVPDFQLNFGQTLLVNVPNVDNPEWIIATYTVTWTDPYLTQFWGLPQPIVLDANYWVAGEIVPEPATLTLLTIGTLALICRRKLDK